MVNLDFTLGNVDSDTVTFFAVGKSLTYKLVQTASKDTILSGYRLGRLVAGPFITRDEVEAKLQAQMLENNYSEKKSVSK